MASPAPVDPVRCPLCGGPNRCGMTEGGSTCWCFSLQMPRELLERVPDDAVGRACVCRWCAEGKVNPEAAHAAG